MFPYIELSVLYCSVSNKMHVRMWEQKWLFPHEEGISVFTDRHAILRYAVASHAYLHGPLSWYNPHDS